jgi:ABC-type amino acid transport substrate-binding protein
MKYLLILLIPISNVFAMNISGIFLPHRLTNESKSSYQVLFKKFSDSRPHLKSKITVAPLKRAEKFFFKKEAMCIFPASKKAITYFHKFKTLELEMIESNPIEEVIITIFSKFGSHPIDNINQLKGKNIATWNGIDPKILIPNIDFKIVKVSKDNQSLSLLKANRVDYVIGFLPDTPLVAELNGFEQPAFNKNIVLLESPVHFVCHKTKETISFLNEFNIFLKSQKSNGTLQKILGKHSIISK